MVQLLISLPIVSESEIVPVGTGAVPLEESIGVGDFVTFELTDFIALEVSELVVRVALKVIFGVPVD
jgi:hypothetical protein